MEINEGGEADRGRARSEGGRAGRREIKDGTGRGSAWTEGVKEEGKAGREKNEGEEAGRECGEEGSEGPEGEK